MEKHALHALLIVGQHAIPAHGREDLVLIFVDLEIIILYVREEIHSVIHCCQSRMEYVKIIQHVQEPGCSQYVASRVAAVFMTRRYVCKDHAILTQCQTMQVSRVTRNHVIRAHGHKELVVQPVELEQKLSHVLAVTAPVIQQQDLNPKHVQILLVVHILQRSEAVQQHADNLRHNFHRSAVYVAMASVLAHRFAPLQRLAGLQRHVAEMGIMIAQQSNVTAVIQLARHIGRRVMQDITTRVFIVRIV